MHTQEKTDKNLDFLPDEKPDDLPFHDYLAYLSACCGKEESGIFTAEPSCIRKLESYRGWYVRRYYNTDTPYVDENGVAHICSDAAYALTALPEGIVYEHHKAYDENLFSQLWRCGASKVAVNEDHDGFCLSIPGMDGDGAESADNFNPALTAATAAYSWHVQASRNDERVASELVRLLSEMPIYYKRVAGKPARMVMSQDNLDLMFQAIFTDKHEYLLSYGTNDMAKAMLDDAMIDVNLAIVVNAASTMVVLGEEMNTRIKEYSKARKSIIDAAVAAGRGKVESEAAAKELMEHPELYREYLGSLGVMDAPVGIPVKVNGYTASLLWQTMADDMLDAYLLMAKMLGSQDAEETPNTRS